MPPDDRPATPRVARIIDVGTQGSRRCTVLIEGVLMEVETPDHAAQPGDVYLTGLGYPPLLAAKIGGAAAGGCKPDGDVMRWRRPDRVGRTRFDALHQRHVIRRAVRDHFDSEGFLEIDAPLLVRGTTPDAVIQSFAVEDRYLVTSTEYQIKRLEVGGFDRVYTLTQNYRRADGEGATRNPEFTMLEWARVGEGLERIEQDAEALVRRAHAALGGAGALKYGDLQVDLVAPFERLTVTAALHRYLGIRLANFTLPQIRDAVLQAGLPVREGWTDDVYLLFSLLMDHLQPRLGRERPVFLQEWPAFETSSASEKEIGRIAERSELFIAGIELSDGFPSLTDPGRQRETFADQQQRRSQDGVPSVALDAAYLAALDEGLPSGAGMALGFDRLVMLLTDRSSIRDVLAFAWDEV